MSRWPKYCLPLLLLALFLGGCGYGFRDYGSGYTVPKDLKTVAIESFANRTYESLVPNYLKNALVAEFARSRRLRVVADPDGADLTISGAILEIIGDYTNLHTLEFDVTANVCDEVPDAW